MLELVQGLGVRGHSRARRRHQPPGYRVGGHHLELGHGLLLA